MVDVTVYDRADGRTLPLYRHDGQYYVVGTPGSEYQVRIRNQAGGDVLAVLSVDGINAVSGETASWSQSGYVLGHGQSFDVKGWRKSMQRVAAFYFTELENSYAARTGRPDNVGVIGVAVFRRKQEPVAVIDAPRPWRPSPHDSRRDAPAESPYPSSTESQGGPSASAAREAEDIGAARNRSESAGAGMRPPALAQRSAPIGTGHGRIEPSRVTYTSFERATTDPAEVISIRYDSYQNLVAMGVIRAPRVARPSPFPGQFVPDPR